MDNGGVWITIGDGALLDSIIKHEGDKAVIYQNIKARILKPAE